MDNAIAEGLKGIEHLSDVPYFPNVDVTSSLIPVAADTYNIGDADHEYQYAYIGTGGIYFGTGQDILLARLAANVVGLAAGDGFVSPAGIGPSAAKLHTLPDVAADTICLLAATQELDNKTLDSSVAKGTWTASGTWTIPSFVVGTALGATHVAGITSSQLLQEVSTDYYYGIVSFPSYIATVGAFAGFASALYGEAVIGATNNKNWTDASYGLCGGYFSHHIAAGATGTVARAASIEVNTDIDAMTVTDDLGIIVLAPSITAPGAVTGRVGIEIQNQGNAAITGASYGLKIDDQSGSPANYAILTGLGTHQFGDSITITRSQNAATKINVQNVGVGASSSTAIFVGENITTLLGGINYLNNSYTLGAGYEAYRANCLAIVTSSGVTGGISIISPVASSVVTVTVGGNATANEVIRFADGGQVFIGDSANANITIGLTINQAANDNIILAFKSSDVAHGLTSVGETDTYAHFLKNSGTSGGLLVQSLMENAAVTNALLISSYGGQADTTKTTAGRSLIEFYASQHNGSNALADIASNGNVFGIRARVGTADIAVAIVDEDGDLWLNGGLTLVGASIDVVANSLTVSTTASYGGMVVQSTNDGSGGADVTLYHVSASPANLDTVASWRGKGKDSNGAATEYCLYQMQIENVTHTTECGRQVWYNAVNGVWNQCMMLSSAGVLTLDHSLLFDQSQDSAAVADQVSLSGYEISAGHRALAISSEEVVVAEVDETKFSHKLPVRINGATYNIMLCAT